MAWTYYTSADASAPTVRGGTGTLIGLLDAILVNGYGSKPAAGWTKPYSGANLAAYRMSTAPGANGHYLYVDDTGAQWTRWLGYASMSSISDTSGEPVPTNAQVSGGLYFYKSNTADTTSRPWICVADEKRFVLIVFSAQTALGATDQTNSSMLFGQGKSNVVGDAYYTLAMGRTNTTTTNDWLASGTVQGTYSPSNGAYVLRAYTGVTGAAAIAKSGGAIPSPAGSPLGGMTMHTYPDQIYGSLNVAPLSTWEAGLEYGAMRGVFPGVYVPLHLRPGSHMDTVSGTGPLAGKDFLMVAAYSGSYAGRLLLQISGEVE